MMVRASSSVQQHNGRTVAMPYSSFALLYDALLGDAMFPLVRRNFEWVARQCGLRFRSAADVACGTGTFVRYLRCRWNIPVFGVDRSALMLRIAMQKNGENEAQFLQQDMRHLHLPHPVDLITCHFDALNYLLSARDLLKAFCRFRTNLTPGGYAVFDMVTDVAPEPQRSVRVCRFDLPGVSSIWAIAWDPVRHLQVVTMHNVFALGTGQYRHAREVHTQRQYPVGVVVALLMHCGFQVCGVLDATSLTVRTPRTSRAIYVVRKFCTASGLAPRVASTSALIGTQERTARHPLTRALGTQTGCEAI
jgi:SAM-dependent methyltransferase